MADALCKAEIEAEKRLEELRAEMSKERRSMAASFASTLGKAVALEYVGRSYLVVCTFAKFTTFSGRRVTWLHVACSM